MGSLYKSLASLLFVGGIALAPSLSSAGGILDCRYPERCDRPSRLACTFVDTSGKNILDSIEFECLDENGKTLTYFSEGIKGLKEDIEYEDFLNFDIVNLYPWERNEFECRVK